MALVSALVAVSAAGLPARAADWKPIERIEPYRVTGTTGPALYASIGERGPKIGMGRAIAYTDFKLTWTRDYQPRDGGCTLVSARPRLIITYRLPKPASKLSGAALRHWQQFIDGIEAHERVHGRMIVDLVRRIEAVSIGLSVPNDPDCRKIRAELTSRLAVLSQEQRRESRDFDRTEMANGGNVHRLILGLVNGR